MNTKSDGISETIILWLIAFLVGIFATVLLMFFADWILIQAIFVGLLVFAVLGVLLTMMMGAVTAEPTAHSDKTVAQEDDTSAVSAPALASETSQTTTTVETETPSVSEPVVSETTEVPSSAPAQPKGLEAPRGGTTDNLKQIKGVGPKLEKLLHSMGFYHFDQIAGWSESEIAWVDENLEGFKGRVTRDKWIEQAKTLASGAETAFSKRVEDGDVY